MARKYKRDKRGRFASTGGGGGKLGKSAKNEKARAKYKQSRRNVKDAQEMKSIASKSKGGKKAVAYAGRQVAGAKSGLTRVTKGLQGGKSRQGSFKQMSKSAGSSQTAKANNKATTPKRTGKRPNFQSGNTRATSNRPTPRSAKEKKEFEKADKLRKVNRELAPKVKAADSRAKDLNREADRLEKGFRRQEKLTKANPTKANKERLKLLQRETRMADRAAKKADREADKLAAQRERLIRRIG